MSNAARQDGPLRTHVHMRPLHPLPATLPFSVRIQDSGGLDAVLPVGPDTTDGSLDPLATQRRRRQAGNEPRSGLNLNIRNVKELQVMTLSNAVMGPLAFAQNSNVCLTCVCVCVCGCVCVCVCEPVGVLCVYVGVCMRGFPSACVLLWVLLSGICCRIREVRHAHCMSAARPSNHLPCRAVQVTRVRAVPATNSADTRAEAALRPVRGRRRQHGRVWRHIARAVQDVAV